MPTGCVNAVGGILLVLFRIPESGRNCNTIRRGVCRELASIVWRCQGQRYIQPPILGDPPKSVQDRPLPSRSVRSGREDRQRPLPVAAGLAYMITRGSAPGLFFRFSDGKGLTRDRFVKAVRLALSSAGVDVSHYSGHSFRIGAATTAFLYGISEVLIKTMGRWESSAYMLYVRTPREQLWPVAQTLGQL